jgi:hypothetical protein
LPGVGENPVQYTDPGSGALLWQMLAVGVVAGSFYFRKVIFFFRKKREKQVEGIDSLSDPS